MVEIAPPPPKRLPVKPVLYSIDKNKCLVRIFDPTKHNTNALSFRYYGALERFDNQQYSRDAPANDEERGIYYAGFTLSCCLVEVFGDKRTIEVGNYCVALVELKRPLSLLDLCGTPAIANGTVVALSSVSERDISQSWSRYFYDNYDTYTKVDGIIYHNLTFPVKSLWQASNPHRGRVILTSLATRLGCQWVFDFGVLGSRQGEQQLPQPN